MNKEATGLGDFSTGKALLKMKLAEFANNLRSIKASSLVRPGIILFCSFVVGFWCSRQVMADFIFSRSRNYLWEVA